MVVVDGEDCDGCEEDNRASTSDDEEIMCVGVSFSSFYTSRKFTDSHISHITLDTLSTLMVMCLC